jgi:DNA-binding SARP family transcriptional activator
VAVTAPTLYVSLFGGFGLRYGETSLAPLESARAESLLAYLALHRQAAQSRQHLAFVLWPDSDEQQARTNLRHLLHTLRRTLPDIDRFLEVTPRTVRWRPDAALRIDVAAFEEALSRSDRDGNDAAVAALREAVDVYRGNLLEGSYDEWLLEERERLRRRYIEVLQRLAAHLEAQGNSAQAIPYAERLVRHDPLREDAYRLLMRLHDARGDRARALRVYHECTSVLARELGTEPSEATRAAYEALLTPERLPAPEERRAGRSGTAPLVGRAAERARLTAVWRAAAQGRAQFVVVTGEPGIGKTRLLHEFRSWCAHRGGLTAEARSYAAEGAFAYGPIVAWLRSEALRPYLRRLNRIYIAELARLVPELLSEVPDLAQPEPLPERDQRQRLFEALAAAVVAPAEPVLLVADDIQWCDRETLQFLHYLLRAAHGARLVVAAAARREDIDHGHPAADLFTGLQVLESFAEIELKRLTRDETTALAEGFAGHRLAPREVDRLYEETEGNPLFVVEALRAGRRWESADGPLMSTRVQAVIRSRLAQLTAPARDLAGVAATVGRAFTTDVVALASGASEGTLVQGLDELWRRRLIREHGADGYDFAHDKIREVAYQALSPATRRRHHACVAHALERLHAGTSGPVSAQIAWHYDRAGAAGQAVTWYGRAAESAQHMHANSDAVRLLDRALDLLRALPATPERDARELDLLTAFPAPLAEVEGYNSSRLTDIQGRAGDLARALGVGPAPPVLRSVALTSLSTGNFEAARGAGEQLRARGRRDGDDVLLVEGHYVLGIAAFWQGELEAARAHFEAAVERYRPAQRQVHLLRYGQDPKVVCLGRLAITLWLLGAPESAVRARDAARALADEIRHPYSRSVTFVFAGILALEMRDMDHLRECVAGLGTWPAEQEPKQTQVMREALGGYLDVLDGRPAAGIARIRRAVDDVRSAQPAPGNLATLALVLVEACAAANDARAGLGAADDALAIANVRLWEAEARRLRADFLAAAGAPPGEIAAELGRALDIARRQRAKLFELRAAVSLLRHYRNHGSEAATSEACDLLAALVAAVPLGPDLPDRHTALAILNRG